MRLRSSSPATPKRWRDLAVKTLFKDELLLVAQVDLNCNPILRISTVVQVIAITSIIYVHVIPIVPISRPILWPRVKKAEPKPPVLKGGIPAKNY